MKPSITLNRNVLKWMLLQGKEVSDSTIMEIFSIIYKQTPELFKDKETLYKNCVDVGFMSLKDSKRGRKRAESLKYSDILNKKLLGNISDTQLIKLFPKFPILGSSAEELAKTAFILKKLGFIKKRADDKAIKLFLSEIIEQKGEKVICYEGYQDWMHSLNPYLKKDIDNGFYKRVDFEKDKKIMDKGLEEIKDEIRNFTKST